MTNLSNAIKKFKMDREQKWFDSEFVVIGFVVILLIFMNVFSPEVIEKNVNKKEVLTVKKAVSTTNGLNQQLNGGEAGICFNNMWQLNLRAVSWLATHTDKNKTIPSTYLSWTKVFHMSAFVCPEGGKYSMDEQGNIICSKHGELNQLKNTVEKNGMLTVDNADNAYNKAINIYVTPNFINNLKTAFTQLTSQQRDGVNNYALLNGYLYAVNNATINKTDDFKIVGNKLVLTNNKYINSLSFREINNKWLIDNVEFNQEFLNPSPAVQGEK